MKINFFFFILISLSIVMCHPKQEVAVPVKQEEALISQSTLSMIKIDTVKIKNIQDEVKLTGMVSFDENRVVKVFPFSSGQVLKVNVSIGDYVKAGQPLAIIKSADISGNYSDLSVAGNDVTIAKRNMENAESLFNAGISSQKEYIEAKENYNKAVSAESKIRDQILINGGGRTSSNGEYVVIAPRSGYVVEKMINPGNFIRNDYSTELFTIGDISEVWIWANVFETDLANVKEGYTATIKTLAYPDTVFIGKIDKINQVLDPVTKVMKIKIVLPNKSNLLKPEMFANITIHHTEGKSIPSIPASALINDNQKTFTIIYKNEDDASIRPVIVNKITDGNAYISEGLAVGEKVITQNQILIYKKLMDMKNAKLNQTVN